MLVSPGDSPRPRLVCGDDPDVGGGRTSAERPRDEPPGQPKASIAPKPTPGWPGRLHRVVRRPILGPCVDFSARKQQADETRKDDLMNLLKSEACLDYRSDGIAGDGTSCSIERLPKWANS